MCSKLSSSHSLQEPSRSRWAGRCGLRRQSVYDSELHHLPRTTMDKQELWRTVLLVIRGLLHSNLRQVPDVYPPVTRSRREYSRVMRGPGQVQDLIGMPLESMKLLCRRPQVMKDNCLVHTVVSTLRTRTRIRTLTLSALPVSNKWSTAGL